MQRIVSNEILLAEVGNLLAEGNKVEIKTKGNSMLPFIIGDRDSVLLIKKENVSVGDIVLAEIHPGHYVLHRIFDLKGNDVLLMGDGNIKGKEKCRLENILGTVELIIKENGRSVTPGDGHIWKKLLPIRRYLLAIYRRII